MDRQAHSEQSVHGDKQDNSSEAISIPAQELPGMDDSQNSTKSSQVLESIDPPSQLPFILPVINAVPNSGSDTASTTTSTGSKDTSQNLLTAESISTKLPSDRSVHFTNVINAFFGEPFSSIKPSCLYGHGLGDETFFSRQLDLPNKVNSPKSFEGDITTIDQSPLLPVHRDSKDIETTATEENPQPQLDHTTQPETEPNEEVEVGVSTSNATVEECPSPKSSIVPVPNSDQAQVDDVDDSNSSPIPVTNPTSILTESVETPPNNNAQKVTCVKPRPTGISEKSSAMNRSKDKAATTNKSGSGTYIKKPQNQSWLIATVPTNKNMSTNNQNKPGQKELTVQERKNEINKLKSFYHLATKPVNPEPDVFKFSAGAPYFKQVATPKSHTPLQSRRTSVQVTKLTHTLKYTSQVGSKKSKSKPKIASVTSGASPLPHQQQARPPKTLNYDKPWRQTNFGQTPKIPSAISSSPRTSSPPTLPFPFYKVPLHLVKMEYTFNKPRPNLTRNKVLKLKPDQVFKETPDADNMEKLRTIQSAVMEQLHDNDDMEFYAETIPDNNSSDDLESPGDDPKDDEVVHELHEDRFTHDPPQYSTDYSLPIVPVPVPLNPIPETDHKCTQCSNTTQCNLTLPIDVDHAQSHRAYDTVDAAVEAAVAVDVCEIVRRNAVQPPFTKVVLNDLRTEFESYISHFERATAAKQDLGNLNIPGNASERVSAYNGGRHIHTRDSDTMTMTSSCEGYDSCVYTTSSTKLTSDQDSQTCVSEMESMECELPKVNRRVQSSHGQAYSPEDTTTTALIVPVSIPTPPTEVEGPRYNTRKERPQRKTLIIQADSKHSNTFANTSSDSPDLLSNAVRNAQLDSYRWIVWNPEHPSQVCIEPEFPSIPKSQMETVDSTDTLVEKNEDVPKPVGSLDQLTLLSNSLLSASRPRKSVGFRKGKIQERDKPSPSTSSFSSFISNSVSLQEVSPDQKACGKIELQESEYDAEDEWDPEWNFVNLNFASLSNDTEQQGTRKDEEDSLSYPEPERQNISSASPMDTISPIPSKNDYHSPLIRYLTGVLSRQSSTVRCGATASNSTSFKSQGQISNIGNPCLHSSNGNVGFMSSPTGVDAVDATETCDQDGQNLRLSQTTSHTLASVLKKSSSIKTSKSVRSVHFNIPPT